MIHSRNHFTSLHLILENTKQSTINQIYINVKVEPWGGILEAPLSLPLTLPLSHVFNGTLMEWKISILKAQLAVH